MRPPATNLFGTDNLSITLSSPSGGTHNTSIDYELWRWYLSGRPTPSSAIRGWNTTHVTVLHHWLKIVSSGSIWRIDDVFDTIYDSDISGSGWSHYVSCTFQSISYNSNLDKDELIITFTNGTTSVEMCILVLSWATYYSFSFNLLYVLRDRTYDPNLDSSLVKNIVVVLGQTAYTKDQLILPIVINLELMDDAGVPYDNAPGILNKLRVALYTTYNELSEDDYITHYGAGVLYTYRGHPYIDFFPVKSNPTLTYVIDQAIRYIDIDFDGHFCEPSGFW